MSYSKLIMLLLLVVFLAFIPLIVQDTYMMHIIIMTLIWTMVTSSYNILLSAGQLSLAHNALFAIGAYCSAILSMKLNWPFIPTMLLGGLLSALVGLGIGRITLKMRGSHFVLVTFAFAEITRLIINNWVSLTNGPMGLRGIPAARIFGYEFWDISASYYLALGLVIITVYICYRMFFSRYGRAFNAIRNSEDLAESVGISYLTYIMIALFVSCFITGIAGSFYAHYVNLVSPELSKFLLMINLLIMCIGGGKYTVTGPIIGALIFTFLPEYLRFLDDYRMLSFGFFLLIIVIFMPEGIYPRLLSLFNKLQFKKA